MELHLPMLELAVLTPLLGALWVRTRSDPDIVRRHSLIVSGLTLAWALGAWGDFTALHTFEAHDPQNVVSQVLPGEVFVIDELSAPLIPLGALLYFLTEFATLSTKVRRFSFSGTLASEAILLATLSCRQPWAVVALLAVGTVPPYLELKRRRKPTRIYVLHMGLYVGLLIAGEALVASTRSDADPSTFAILLLAFAVLVRSGMIPVHCWITDLFEHASFGRALLFVTPMVGAYGAVRLVLPIAPDWILQMVAVVSLATALYAAGMALVQRDVRRFFCYVFLSHSSLVLVGLETATPLGVTGALCVWFSVGLAMGGFGLTLRSVEVRQGHLSLDRFHGLHEHMPKLAAFFLLTGLAAIGFPGTIGFVAIELLVEGAVDVAPLAGVAVVVTAMLNGLAVLFAYFRVFTGTHHPATIDLSIRPPERLAVLVLTLAILGGGIFPQPGVASRYHAAMELVDARRRRGLHEEHHADDIGISGGRAARRGLPAPAAPIQTPRARSMPNPR